MQNIALHCTANNSVSRILIFYPFYIIYFRSPNLNCFMKINMQIGWLGSRMFSMLDSGANLGSNRSRDAVG